MRFILFLVLNIDCINLGFAQSIPGPSTKSPEASTIDKFIETPVSYFTGTANVSIPIYQIKIKDVLVPISLNYNTGGIRVNEEATSVGLGWSINYGGQISRKIKGKPDEYSFLNGATQNNTLSIASFLSLPNVHQDAWLNDRNTFIRNCKDPSTKFDLMPDEFYYSGLEYSGRFMYNQSVSKFVLFPKEDINVNYSLSSNLVYSTYHPIDSWNLQLPNGTTMLYGLDGISTSGQSGKVVNTDLWMIKKITNIYNESILYNYGTPINKQFVSPLTEFFSFNDKSTYSSQSSIDSYQAPIKTIIFPNGSINFIYTTREDNNDQAISEIDIYGNNNQLLKRINFSYSYFIGNFQDMSSIANPVAYETKRLKLDVVSMSNNSAPTLTYTLKYNYDPNLPVPSKNSFSQDFWGYFNGAYNNTLIPKLNTRTDQNVSGDRNPNPSFNSVFSLQSITYPTGAKTEFTYETNTVTPDGAVSALNNFQANNMISDGVGISLYGNNRLAYNLNPDMTGPSGEKYFYKNFIIPPNGGYSVGGNGWGCTTNYLQNNSTDMQLDCYNFNVDFKLESANPDGTFSLLKFFRSRDCNNVANPYLSQNNAFLNYLNPGNYRLSVILYFNPNSDPTFINHNYNVSFNIAWNDHSSDPSLAFVNAGGLRINKINTYNNDGSVALSKSYSYIDPNTNKPSGRLVSAPLFLRSIWFHPTGHAFPDNYTGDIQISANSVSPLLTTSGNNLGYTFVTEEILGNDPPNDNIKIRYNYSFENPYYDGYYTTLDQAVTESQEWKRGKLLSTTILKNNIPQKVETYQYYQFSPHLNYPQNEDYVEEINTDFISNSLVAVAGQSIEDFYDQLGAAHGYPQYKYAVDNILVPNDVISTIPGGAIPGAYRGMDQYYSSLPYFKRYTGFDKPLSKQITLYDENGNVLTSTENFFYDKTPTHNQLTRSQSLNSKGESIVTQLSYPSDFVNLTPYNTMFQRNMKNRVISNSSSKNSQFIRSFKTNYQDWGNNIIAPLSNEETFGTNSPQAKMIFSSYDNFGNILQASKPHDFQTSYLWGYNQQELLAEVVNANQSDIAYTSFEDNYNYSTQGNWNFQTTAVVNDPTSPTGTVCFLLNGSYQLTKYGLSPSTTYVVSYWSKSGSYNVSGSNSVNTGKTLNGWTRFEHIVTNVSTLYIYGNGYIDEVRLYPQGSHMKTYSYTPLIGVTSICDVNNSISYYEYDNSNRLRLIRDQDKNILKKFCYNYLGQSADCDGSINLACTYNQSYTTYNVALTNLSTNSTTNYSIPYMVSTALPLDILPAGMYNVSIVASAGPGFNSSHSISFGNYSSYTYPSTLNLYNVPLSGNINIGFF